METLRHEKRQPRDPPPALVQKHAEEVAELERRLASHRVRSHPLQGSTHECQLCQACRPQSCPQSASTTPLQEELETFKGTAEEVAEAKDAELQRILSVNASLRDEITVLQSQVKLGLAGGVTIPAPEEWPLLLLFKTWSVCIQ